MNIITYNAAYSLYPYATFVLRQGLVINEKNSRAQDALMKSLMKYGKRRWRIMKNNSPLLSCLPPQMHGLHFDSERWVCDQKSWVV